MKKAISCVVITILILLFVFTNSYAESEDGTFFSTKLLQAFDMNAKEWMSSETTITLLAALMLDDYVLQGDTPYDVSGMYYGTTFVGRVSLALVLGYNAFNSDDSLMIIYVPSENTVAYTVNSFNKSELESAMNGVCSDGYYKIDGVNLKETNEAILEALDNL